MSTEALRQLAAAIQCCSPGDVDGASAIREKLEAALEACTADDPCQAEALLSCLVESFTAAGDNGQVCSREPLLDDLVLEVLPAVAGFAQLSEACSKRLSAFCRLVAVACSPRETIAAFLETLDNLQAAGPGPDGLQFACELLLLLPHQVAKLSRRKTANALECCAAAASLAQVHGEALTSWTLAQLALAAQQDAASSSGDGGEPAAVATLSKLDTFLAAHWQAYVEFARQMAQEVLPQESDPASRQSACTGLSTLVLRLLQHLTGLWPPQCLRELVLKLLQGSGSAQLLPSSDSVAPPVPLLAASMAEKHRGSTGGFVAETVVLELVSLLRDCGVTDWQQLPCSGDTIVVAGAGLAALYSSCMDSGDQQVFGLPNTPVEAMQLACLWCCALVEASDGNTLAVLKAIALVQLASAHAHHLRQHTSPGSSDSLSAAGAQNVSSTEDAALPEPHPGQGQTTSPSQPDAQVSSTVTPADDLVPAMQPCVTMLAGVMAHAPIQALRSQAALTLQQLLQALPPAVCYGCLQQLLLRGAPDGVHPEVAALLMQEVRGHLARSGATAEQSDCFDPGSCVQLVAPWLTQEGPVGWHTSDALPDRANAICAALAVVRLALLRHDAAAKQKPTAAPAGATVPTAQLQGLKAMLMVLSAAVTAELQALQAASEHEQEQDVFEQVAVRRAAGDGRMCVPGEAQGSGLAVDAWLAVSRVQDVLDRVMQLV